MIKIADDNFGDKIYELYQNKGGVYKIVAIKSGRPIPIHRFLGKDLDGILYIGKATSFLDRVVALKKSIAPDYKGKSHICGRRYKLFPNIAVKFPYESLFVVFIPTENPEVLERSLILGYTNQFGEVPPLNAV